MWQLASLCPAIPYQVGDGSLRSELEDLAFRLGLQDKVVFTGYLEDVRLALGTFDVNVLPSIAGEGFGLTILEGMAMGKPAVVTDMVEIIHDGIDGLVVPRGDSEALAARIAYLLGNEDEAKRLGSAAREKSTQYDSQPYAERLGQTYDALLLRN